MAGCRRCIRGRVRKQRRCCKCKRKLNRTTIWIGIELNFLKRRFLANQSRKSVRRVDLRDFRIHVGEIVPRTLARRLNLSSIVRSSFLLRGKLSKSTTPFAKRLRKRRGCRFSRDVSIFDRPALCRRKGEIFVVFVCRAIERVEISRGDGETLMYVTQCLELSGHSAHYP